MNTPAQTVQQTYQSFGRGDIPAILAFLAPDVQWEVWNDHSAQRAGVPWLQARRGVDGVMAFFIGLAALQIHDFQVLDVVGDGPHVVGVITVDMTVHETGRRLRDEEIHLWRFDDQGRVASLRHFIDTAKHIHAAGKVLPT